MYGAILGDIIGSRFEFDRGPWTKKFELLTDACQFTDDTVMTVAVAHALLLAGKHATTEEIKAECIHTMKLWGKNYPNAGYGARFIGWVLSDDPEPYGSLGNGSAMRVSAAGWLYDSMERTREVARATAEVSHNHPEGIKGAECTAAVIFLGRTGATKEEIKAYVEKEFGYDLSKTVKKLRPLHRHDETCMDALPKALAAFLEGESYEDTVRNAVSLGGDTDTIAAIAGAMAEAFFGMPEDLRIHCQMRVEEDMQEVMAVFDKVLGRRAMEDDAYADNDMLQKALLCMTSEKDREKRREDFALFLDVLADRMACEGVVPMPFVDADNVFESEINLEKMKEGDTIKLESELRLTMDTMMDGEGVKWIPLFLSEAELQKGETANVIMPVKIYDVLKAGLAGSDVAGVVINPFGKSFLMEKELLEMFMTDYDAWIEQRM